MQARARGIWPVLRAHVWLASATLLSIVFTLVPWLLSVVAATLASASRLAGTHLGTHVGEKLAYCLFLTSPCVPLGCIAVAFSVSGYVAYVVECVRMGDSGAALRWFRDRLRELRGHLLCWGLIAVSIAILLGPPAIILETIGFGRTFCESSNQLACFVAEKDISGAIIEISVFGMFLTIPLGLVCLTASIIVYGAYLGWGGIRRILGRVSGDPYV